MTLIGGTTIQRMALTQLNSGHSVTSYRTLFLPTSSFSLAQDTALFLFSIRKWNKKLSVNSNQALEKKTAPCWNVKIILGLHLSSISPLVQYLHHSGNQIPIPTAAELYEHQSQQVQPPSAQRMSFRALPVCGLRGFLSDSCGLLKASGTGGGLTAPICLLTP